MTQPAPDLPPDAPRVGEDRYVLLSRLGEGGMSVVYGAWDQDLRIWRAVKVLLPEYAGRPSVRRRFEREARTMMSIRSPHLVRVYEVHAETALPYFVMDLVAGGSLEQWTVRYGAMPPRLAVEVTIQVCRGLVAVHDAGVVHRDVKPQNILTDLDGRCKLTDFGVAQMEGGDTRTGVSMGTVGYMSPEQVADSKSVDVRTDIYATGASLYVLLTRRPVRDLFRVSKDPTLLTSLHKGLRPIVTRCIAYDREQRYPDAQALLQELIAARDFLPSLSPDTPSLVLPALSDIPGGSPGEYTELGGLLGKPWVEPDPAADKRSLVPTLLLGQTDPSGLVPIRAKSPDPEDRTVLLDEEEEEDLQGEGSPMLVSVATAAAAGTLTLAGGFAFLLGIALLALLGVLVGAGVL